MSRHDGGVSSAGPSRAAPAVASAPRELSNEAVTRLLTDALARRPVVARLPLGDVATIDKNGKALPLYPRLAQAQLVQLRYCRFPGGDAPANQICLADLTDSAKPYVYAGDTPLKTIAADSGELQAKNRSVVQIILAVPRVSRIDQITERGRGEKQIGYSAVLDLTPLATAFGVTAESLPSPLSGTAEARMRPSGWTIETDGLQQTEAKAQ